MKPSVYKPAQSTGASALALLSVFGALAAVGSLTACGKQAFVPGVNAQKQASPGNFEIPAKVDVLLAQDDTGSMVQVFNQLKAQMPAFLSTLEDSGWDYRFGVTPLTTPRAIDQVIGSKYDGNWSSLGQWKSPYPGARPEDSMLAYSLFRTPDAFARFLSDGETYSSYQPMTDPGLSTIISQVQNSSSWIRQDAYLVVVAITNGEDGGGVNLCTRTDGLVEQCSPSTDWAGYGGQYGCKRYPQNTFASCASVDNRESTWQARKSSFAALKGNHEMLRFNSMIAMNRGAGCQGQYAYFGERYKRMSNEFSGTVGGAVSVDICSASVSSLLSQTTQQLQATRLAMRTRYLVLEREPNVSTIRVIKYPGGNKSQAQTIEQNASNGWTYAGLTSAYLIDYPVPTNYVSNKYLIELHGSARLVGNDDAAVEYERH